MSRGKKLVKKSGSEYEQMVKAIHALWGDAFTITTNEKIRDHKGIEREFDVVFRGKVGPYNTIGVAECKDHGRKVEMSVVDAFQTKANSIGANLKAIYSARGFAKNAISLAESYGIWPASIVDTTAPEPKFKLKSAWYVDIISYRITGGSIEHDGDKIEPPPDIWAITFEGEPVYGMILSWLSKNAPSGKIEVCITTKKNGDFRIGNQSVGLLKKMKMTLESDSDRRAKLINIEAKGVYNWSTKQISVPANATLSTRPVTTDFANWPKCPPNEWGKKYSDLDITMKAMVGPQPIAAVQMLDDVFQVELISSGILHPITSREDLPGNGP